MPRWLGVLILLTIATAFGANHVAARLAFDHGVDVTTAVAVRSLGTAIFVIALLRFAGVSLRVPGTTLRRGLAIGVLIAVQSWCLYSAVARIPVALALLAFNTFPIMLGLISWLAGGERPARRTLIAMPIALAGLALALDIAGLGASGAGRGTGVGAAALAAGTQPGFAAMLPGVAFALGGSTAFGLALYLIGHWLPAVDGRLRTLMFMVVVAVVAIAAAGLGGGFSWPHDATGWTGLSLLTMLYGSAITTLFVVLPRIGAVNNAAIMNFEPVAALALGWLVLGQTVGAVQMAGGCIVIGAIVYLSLGRR
ncbi:MAG TPA: DMT family transporter [Burkholderiaceae bacterium]|nr:DMT family transporter [Burkholderiaceae bacterium]